jgi:hypothetical protein
MKHWKLDEILKALFLVFLLGVLIYSCFTDPYGCDPPWLHNYEKIK